MPAERRSEPELNEVLAFMQLVWALDSGLQSVSKAMERTLGVTGPQRLVVRVLGLRPGIAPGDLAKVLRVHPSTLTGVLRRLEEKRLIVREADPADRRRARLKLAKKGEALNRMQVGTVEDAVRRTLQDVPAEAVNATRYVLTRLADALFANAHAEAAS